MKATKKLSSGLLQMKFMTKTRKKAEEQEEQRKNTELQKEFLPMKTEETGEEPTTAARRELKICKSLPELEDLSFGRMSFKGFNPEVEKLMAYYARKKRGELSDEEEEEDDEADVTDAQMAKTLSGAAGSIQNKFGRGGRGAQNWNQRRKHPKITVIQAGNTETGSHRLNFDASSIRKRKSDAPEDFSHYPPKFLKPSDD